MKQLLSLLFCVLTLTSGAQLNALSSSDAATSTSQPRTCAAHERHIEMMGLQKYAAARERIDNHREIWDTCG